MKSQGQYFGHKKCWIKHINIIDQLQFVENEILKNNSNKFLQEI